jgi:hypothetical protein
MNTVFEDACIKKIKKSVPEATVVVKREGIVYVLVGHYIPTCPDEGLYESHGKQLVKIGYDPRPDENDYKISIKEISE